MRLEVKLLELGLPVPGADSRFLFSGLSPLQSAVSSLSLFLIWGSSSLSPVLVFGVQCAPPVSPISSACPALPLTPVRVDLAGVAWKFVMWKLVWVLETSEDRTHHIKVSFLFYFVVVFSLPI